MSILLSIFLACGEKDHDHDTGEDTAAEPSSEESTELVGEPSGDATKGQSIVNAMCMGCHTSNPEIGDAMYLTDEEPISFFDNGHGYMPPINLIEQ